MMKHYKDQLNNIYAYDADGSQDEFIKPGLVKVSDTELAVLRAPSPAQIEKAESDSAKQTLAALDLQSLPLIREYIASLPSAPPALKAIQAAVVEAMKKVKP